MKKILILAVIALGFSFTAQSQVKLGLGVGYASPLGDLGDSINGGISFHGELGYGVNEKIDASFVLDGAILVSLGEEGENANALLVNAYLANGRYYFTDGKFKPYGSLGLGMASISRAGGTYNGVVDVDFSETNFAFRPAVGFKYGVFNMYAAYLNAGKVEDTAVSHFSVNLGLLFTFGGN